MKLTAKVNGQLVRQGLQDLGAETPKIGRRQLRTVMDRIKRRMQVYPPEPEGQSVTSHHPVLGTVYSTARGRYHRTGNLGSHWAINEISNGYEIENTAQRKGRKYGGWVVGNARGGQQARVHKGRWPLLRDVADDEINRLPPVIRDNILMIARSKGFRTS